MIKIYFVSKTVRKKIKIMIKDRIFLSGVLFLIILQLFYYLFLTIILYNFESFDFTKESIEFTVNWKYSFISLFQNKQIYYIPLFISFLSLAILQSEFEEGMWKINKIYFSYLHRAKHYYKLFLIYFFVYFLQLFFVTKLYFWILNVINSEPNITTISYYIGMDFNLFFVIFIYSIFMFEIIYVFYEMFKNIISGFLFCLVLNYFKSLPFSPGNIFYNEVLRITVNSQVNSIHVKDGEMEYIFENVINGESELYIIIIYIFIVFLIWIVYNRKMIK